MKGNLLQGTARGRLGNVIGKVVHGKQIYSNYQPNVANPRTELQIRNRDIFKTISDSYSQLINEFKQYGFGFQYNLYSGASKTLRGLFFDFAFQANRIGTNGPNHTKINFVSPLVPQSTIGNLLVPFASFLSDLDLFPVFTADEFDPGVSYFGSDVPLDSSARIIILGTSTTSPYYTVKNNSYMDVALTMADRSTAIGLPKSFGMYATIAECGEWNYIYSCDASAIDSGGTVIPYSTTKNYVGYYYFFVDKFGRIISSGSQDSLKTLTP